jgi:hypothetical protein
MSVKKVTRADFDAAADRVASRRGVTVPALRSQLAAVTDGYAADPTRCDICEDKLTAAAVTAGRDTCGRDDCRKAKSRSRQAGGAL